MHVALVRTPAHSYAVRDDEPLWRVNTRTTGPTRPCLASFVGRRSLLMFETGCRT